jgi:hypothetical protein
MKREVTPWPQLCARQVFEVDEKVLRIVLCGAVACIIQ